MSVAMAAPAFGATTFYASVRYDTFYLTQKADTVTNAAGDDSATTVINEAQSNSRIGAKFSEGNLSGQWEMGLTASNLRLAYGVYKFGGGSLLVGQTYNPWTFFSDQAYWSDNGNIGFGALYDGRQSQVKLTLDSGLYVTFVNPHTGTALVTDSVQYVQLPKVGIGYDGKAGNTSFGGGFAYQTYKEKNEAANWDENINAFLLYAHAAVNVGMVTIKTNVHYGQNVGTFGLSGRTMGTPTLTATGGVDNTDGYGGFLAVSAKVSPTVGVNVGAGFTRDKKDDVDYDQTTVYVNAPIEIAPHFHVVPEFDYFHFNQAGAYNLGQSNVGLSSDIKDVYVVGAKWQFDF
jgi:hypothetical protein